MTDKDTQTAHDLVTETPPADPNPGASLNPAKVEAGLAPPPPKKPAPPKKRVRKPSKATKAKAAKAVKESAEAAKRGDEFAGEAIEHRSRVKREANSAAYEAVQLGVLDTSAKLPTEAALVLRFADGSAFIDGKIKVDRDFLSNAGLDRVTYDKDIDFEPEGLPELVTEAWLIASNGDAVRCEIAGGLRVGGGHSAKIPAKHLLF